MIRIFSGTILSSGYSRDSCRMAAKENVPFLLLLFIILFVEQVSIFGENFLTINKRGNDLINTRRKEFVFLVDAYYSYFQISFCIFFICSSEYLYTKESNNCILK